MRIKKITQILCVTMTLLLMCNGMVFAEAIQPKKIEFKNNESVCYIDGKVFQQQGTNKLMNGCLFVPMDGIGKLLGIHKDSIFWNEETQAIIIIRHNGIIQLTIGSPKIMINGNSVQMNMNTLMIDNKTYVPVKSFAELLGYTTQWNEQMSVLTIYYENKDQVKEYIENFMGAGNTMMESLKTHQLALNALENGYDVTDQLKKQVDMIGELKTIFNEVTPPKQFEEAHRHMNYAILYHALVVNDTALLSVHYKMNDTEKMYYSMEEIKKNTDNFNESFQEAIRLFKQEVEKYRK